jgi:acyl-CoA thioesterase FadM
VVARIEIDLRAEVRPGDGQVTVRIQAERLGTTSLTTRETILARSGEVVAEARVVTVRWDPGQRKPVPFSEAERGRLTRAAGAALRERAAGAALRARADRRFGTVPRRPPLSR